MEYKGIPCEVIENELVKITVLPDIGGKVASVFYKPQNFEVLFQPTEDKYLFPVYSDDFGKYDTSGWDECFPNIDKDVYNFEGHDLYNGVNMVDHGELWAIPWMVQTRGNKIYSTVNGIDFKYIFERIITLEKNKIHVEYEVNNYGSSDFAAIWAFHGLIACDEKTKFNLNTNQVINVHESSFLGEEGKIHTFPLTKDLNGNDYDLSQIRPKSSLKSEKIYINGVVSKGEASMTLNNDKLLYTMNFPKEKLPYLGLWINECGFKNEYNCAIEPTNGFYDSLTKAQKYNKYQIFKAGEITSWYIDIILEEK